MELIHIHATTINDIGRLVKRPDLFGIEIDALHAALRGDSTTDGLAEQAWCSPDNAPGGNGAAFYEILGDDGVARILARGDIDLCGIDPQEQPWFSVDTESCSDAELETAQQEREFFAVFEDDEAKALRGELTRTSDNYDVYNATAYAVDLLEVFEAAIGVVREPHYES